MIDIKLIRENPEAVKSNIKKKFQEKKLVLADELIEKDARWRALKQESDALRAERNSISREINEEKKAGKNTSELLKKAKEIPDKIAETETEMAKLEEEINVLLKEMPNIIHPNVPLGKDFSQNKELKKIGKPKSFAFPVKSSSEIGEGLGVLDCDSSSNTSGNGFYYLEGELALLNQALIRFAIDVMVKKGYRYVETPLMLRSSVINNVVDLNDLKNQIYKVEGEDLYLIGTSEHSLIGRYIDTIIQEKRLPIKQASYSMCFRREIGSHGIDEKGLFRTHQFNKIEMVVICYPKESMKFFKEMQEIAIEIFRALKMPIRVLAICSGDLGDLKHIQVDIEAWSPRKKEYFEVGSCSNLTDAQARMLKIRVDGKEGKYAPHILNNTALATSRALVAILENNQQKDGSVVIPKALVKYMNGKKKIEALKKENIKKK